MLRLAAQSEFLHERSVVAHIVRHDDAPFGRGRTEYRDVVLTRKFGPLLLYRYSIDSASSELVSDRAGEVLVEQ